MKKEELTKDELREKLMEIVDDMLSHEAPNPNKVHEKVIKVMINMFDEKTVFDFYTHVIGSVMNLKNSVESNELDENIESRLVDAIVFHNGMKRVIKPEYLDLEPIELSTHEFYQEYKFLLMVLEKVVFSVQEELK